MSSKAWLVALAVALVVGVVVLVGAPDAGTRGVASEASAAVSEDARASAALREAVADVGVPRAERVAVAPIDAVEATAAPRPRGDGPLTLRGRAVRQGGAPIAKSMLEVVLVGDSFLSVRVPTDDVGRFEVRVGPELVGLDAVRISTRGPGTHAGLRVRSALPVVVDAIDVASQLVVNVALPEPDADGWDLGDVVFGAPPRTVRGRVVDTAGRAVAEASVSAVPLLARALPLDRRDAYADRDGRFQITCDSGDAAYRLMIGAEGFVGIVRDIAQGETDAGECVLERTAVLRGRVSLPDGAAEADLRVALVPERAGDVGTADAGGPWIEVALERDGSFEMPDIYGGGVARIELSGPDWIGLPIVAFAGVRLGRARDGAADELGTADLRGAVAATRLIVRGPNGAPLLHAEVLHEGSARSVVAASAASAAGALLHARAGVDVTVRAASARAREVRLAGGEQRVTLAPPLWARVDVAGWDAKRDRELRVVFVDPDGVRRDLPLAILDGTVRRSMERPGPWRVAFVRADAPDTLLGPPTTIAIGELTGFQRFSVPVPR